MAFDTNQLILGVIWGFLTLVIIGIGIGFFFVIRYFIKYKHTSVIVTYTDDGYPTLDVRKTSFIKKKGTHMVEFLGLKDKILRPAIKLQYPKTHGKGKVLLLDQYGNDDFSPMSLHRDNPPPHLEAVPEDLKIWMHNENQAEMVKYSNQTWWEKYGEFVVPLTGIMIITIIFIIGLREMRETSAAFQQVANVLKEAIEMMGKQQVPAGP